MIRMLIIALVACWSVTAYAESRVWLSFSGKLHIVELPSPFAMDFLPNEIVRTDDGAILRNGARIENLDRDELIVVVREFVENACPAIKRKKR